MSDKYIDEMIDTIETNINNENYFLAGDKFFKITKYGIIVTNRIAVLIASELADVFRNSLSGVKEFKKDLNLTNMEKLISSIKELLKFLKLKEEDLDVEKKNKIFDLLLFIIYNSEKIQAEIEDLDSNQRIRRIYPLKK